MPADLDETQRTDELPRAYAGRMAQEKAAAVAALLTGGGHFVVAGDTVVACGSRVLPKAETQAEARACLDLLSGRRHRVYGGLCVLAPDGRRASRVVMTHVAFKRLSAEERDWYLSTGDWRGKAGGYAIQGPAARFVRQITGSYPNVVGLCVASATAMLAGLGFPVFGPIADSTAPDAA